MKRKKLSFIIFIISSLSLIISLKLFWNMGIYADEYNTTPSVVCGSDFWLYMDWLRLALLVVIVVASGIELFKK